jgi:drug/metabolite transporter (DMT)-like permease
VSAATDDITVPLFRLTCAVALFGLAGVLGKLTALPAVIVVLGRTIIATPALAIIALLSGVPLAPTSRRQASVLVGLGVLAAVHWTTFFQSITVSNVAIGLLSFSSFPLFTAALEPLLLHHSPRPMQLLAALLILPGVFLLVPSISLTNQVTVGVAWGLVSGGTFAFLTVINRWLRRSVHSITISVFQDGIAALVLLPAMFVVQSAGLWRPSTLLLLLALGILCTALAHTLFISGLGSISAQAASLIASLEPVWGIVFAFVLLGEVPATRTLEGGSIIVLATMLPALWSIRRKSARSGPDTAPILPPC